MNTCECTPNKQCEKCHVKETDRDERLIEAIQATNEYRR